MTVDQLQLMMAEEQLRQQTSIYILTVLELGIRMLAFAIAGLGAAIWTHIQWIKYKNIRDTAKKQKILDDINRKIAEDNLRQSPVNIGSTHVHPMNMSNVIHIDSRRDKDRKDVW